ncbi:MAG: UvrD-helicase domain-containing protein, partial [Thermoguttaceae bacterium]|nr:UvrD-helicase domain-containing protein [Thermoguttaceae bacterium]
METHDLKTELLNPAQQEAVNHIDGPMLVLAGPGSGKTRVVTHRIANLIAHGIAPRNILAMTFTNKAADEMKSRVEQLVPTAGRKLWVSTFHKFCAWQIRMHGEIVGLKDNYTIYDTADSKRLFKMVLDRLKPEYKFTPAGLITEVRRLKSQMILPEDFNPSPRNGRQCALKQIYEEYQAALLTANAVDFDDMLIHTVTMLKKDEELRAELDARYRYVLVDEYQDTNAIQYEIVKLLNRDYQNIQVTGDPDQSIYGWRGAEIRNILDFEKDYPNVKTVRLEKNYRSTPEILHVADELIANNRQRKEKTLFTDNKSGAPVHLVCLDDEFDEAEFVAKKVELLVKSGLAQPNDIAVFYRTNAQSRPFEEKFNIYNLPYVLINAVEFFQRKEIKDVMAYLRLLSNPMDDVSFVRIVNCPARGIGDATVEKLADYALQQGIPLLQAAWEVERIPTIKGKSKAAIQDFIRI